MNIWHISDTHSFHNLLTIPKDIDIVIHSGDASNYKDIYKNETEFKDFLYWYSRLPIKYKIFVAGNHDGVVENNLFDIKKQMKDENIIYLENSDVTINNIKIWGSPHTPTFGNWSFMKSRQKISRVWDDIPEDTDVIICHGPPKGVLDLTINRNNDIERCGCNAFKKRILQINPKLVLFGHIHNYKDITNSGTLKLATSNTIYSNGSVVTDREFGKLSSNGNILNINN